MRLTLRLLALTMMALGVLAWAGSLRPAPAFADMDGAALSIQVVELTNLERSKAGLAPLQWNDTLAAQATSYAQDMAARDFFSHFSPEGRSPWDRAREAGYPSFDWGVFVGENLARGYPTAEAVMQGWMGSEGHRANLLRPDYREIAVGVAVAPDGSRVWVEEFGNRPGLEDGTQTTE